MRTLGKILLFIGGICFFVWGILLAIDIVTALITAPATYLGTVNGLFSLVVAILWFLLDILGGYSGIVYALLSRRWGWVQTLSIVIIVLFVLNLIVLLVTSFQSKTWAWKDWQDVVYGGMAGLLYVLGYFFVRRRH